MAAKVESVESQIKKLVASGTRSSIGAGDGLRLLRLPSGRYSWQYNYVFAGRQKTISYGPYPLTSLALAEERHRAARDHIYNGRDPMTEREEARKAASASALSTALNLVTLKEVSDLWLEDRSANWTARSTKQATQSLEDHVYPQIGGLPISTVTTDHLLTVFRTLENVGKFETTRRVYQRLNQIFEFGMVKRYCPSNPVPILRKQLRPAPRQKPFPTIPVPDLRKLLLDIDGYDGRQFGDVTRLALAFMSLVFVRTGELIHSVWTDVNFDTATLTIPESRLKIKGRGALLVPLSRQAIQILLELKGLHPRLIFPSPTEPGKPISNNTMLFALYRLGYYKKMSGHGFRSLASTILNSWEWNKDWVEKQLTHEDEKPVREVYNNAEYLAQRTNMMQWYADFFDRVRAGADVFPQPEAA